MADGVDITPGSGATVLTDDCGASGHAQGVKLAYSADGVATFVQVDADGLLVNLGGNNDVVVSGVVEVYNTGTFVVQVDNTELVDIETNTDSLAVVGNGAAATSQRVTIANDSTGILAGITTVSTVSVVTNLSQLGGQAIAMGTGVRSAGTQRVTIATDDVVPASQSGTWNITNISGSVSLPTGAATEITLSSLDGKVTACNTSAVVLSSGTVTSLTQMNGQAIAMGTGVRSAGTQRVTIATDDVVPASQSGTWTVQPGNTANTTPWLVSQTPATTGGLTTYHLVSAASTNATVVKGSAGQLYGYYIYNANASARKVAFHNTASTPTAGASIFFSIMIPAGSGANVAFPSGISFSSGIAITTVTGIADSNNTAVAASDLLINLFYK